MKIEFLSVHGSVMLSKSCRKEAEEELGFQTCILLSLMTLLCSVNRFVLCLLLFHSGPLAGIG